MKKAFHNIFGGKKEREKEKDSKTLEAGSVEDHRYGSALSLDSASSAHPRPKSTLSSNPSFSEPHQKPPRSELIQDKQLRRQQQREKSPQKLQHSEPQQPHQQQLQHNLPQQPAAEWDTKAQHQEAANQDRRPSAALASDVSDPQSQKSQPKQRRKDSKKQLQIQHPKYQMQPFDGGSEGWTAQPSRSLPYQTAEMKHSLEKISSLQQTIAELETALQASQSQQQKSRLLPPATESLAPGNDTDLCHDLGGGTSASTTGCSVCGCNRLTSSSSQMSPSSDDITTSSLHVVITSTTGSQTDGVEPAVAASAVCVTANQWVQTEPVAEAASVGSAELSSEIARLASVQQQLAKVPLLPLGSRGGESPAVPPGAVTSAAVQTDGDGSPSDDTAQQLAILREQFNTMVKSKEGLEEQRNELEEAENDARLMVQRMEMKLFTAGEVERMLTAELTESRESCSHLQRQLTSAKLRHQTELRARQADCANALERARVLEKELEELRAQLHQKREVPEDGGQEEVQDGTHQRQEGENCDDLRQSEGSSPLPCEKSSTFSDSGVGEELLRATDAATPSEENPASPAGASPTRLTISYPDAAAPNRCDTVDPPTPVVCSICSGELVNASMTAVAGNSLDFILNSPWAGPAGSEAAPLGQDSRLRRGPLKKDASTDEDVIDQLKNSLQQQLNDFEDERNQMITLHCNETKALQEERALLQSRLRASETLLTSLRDELQLSADELQLAQDPAETAQLSGGLSTDLGGELSPSALLQRVRETRRSELRLASQISELEKKENAYRETLEEADRIMQAVEQRHLRTVEELEHQLREAKNRINFMEGTEEKWKAALYSSSGKRDQQRVAELLDKLIETETEDLKLKEKVYRLERREREQSIRVREEERTSERLRLELTDQEELLRELDAARRELANARDQQGALAALRQRAAELQLNERRLRERCEELEQTESTLQDQLNRTQKTHSHRERRLSEQLELRQHEGDSLQAQLVELQLQQVAATEELAQLRRELQVSRRQLQRAENDSSDGNPREDSYHDNTEVDTLRNQLSQVTRQLGENKSRAADLSSQLERLQGEHLELRQTLESERSRSEQDILQLNLALSRREEEAVAMTSQLARTQATRELDTLSEQESTLIRLLALVRATETRQQACPACSAAADGVLSSLALSLEQLLQLLAGGNAGADRSLQAQLRDAEALSAAAARLARPPGVSTAVQTDAEQRVTQLEGALQLRVKELSAAGEQLRQLQQQLADEKESKEVAARQQLEAEERQERRLSDLRERERRADEKQREKSPPMEDGPPLSDQGSANGSSKLSRIPRRLSKNPEPASAPVHTSNIPRKVSPPSRVPLPRRSQSVRDATAVPPVGVARPYRSALVPLAASSRQRLTAAPTPCPPVREASPPTAAPDLTSAEPTSCLPSPARFQITRAVGGDSLLLYWSPVEDDRITGYQIFVDSQLQLQIRNPQRTKALLPGMDLSSQLSLSIRAVAAGDAVSPLSCTEYQPPAKAVC